MAAKVEDYLDQDPEIRGQKYVCLSFLSPEDIIKQKEVFAFEKFMSAISNDMRLLWDQMYENFKDNIDFTDSLNKLEERYTYLFKPTTMSEEYVAFKSQNAKDIDVDYMEKNNFQTSIRGIKVRGSYETLREAEIRAQVLKRMDAVHNIYIAEVGCWCPWAPNPDEISNSAYAESTLNTLMKSYAENQADKDAFYASRKEELKERAMETNTIKRKLIEKENDGAVVDVSVAMAATTIEEVGSGKSDVQGALEMDDLWMQRKQETVAP
jgi:hypothetical protein